MDWMDNINRQSTSRLCGHIYKNYIKGNVVCLIIILLKWSCDDNNLSGLQQGSFVH